jgi:hypothetical protein
MFRDGIMSLVLCGLVDAGSFPMWLPSLCAPFDVTRLSYVATSLRRHASRSFVHDSVILKFSPRIRVVAFLQCARQPVLDIFENPCNALAFCIGTRTSCVHLQFTGGF